MNPTRISPGLKSKNPNSHTLFLLTSQQYLRSFFSFAQHSVSALQPSQLLLSPATTTATSTSSVATTTSSDCDLCSPLFSLRSSHGFLSSLFAVLCFNLCFSTSVLFFFCSCFILLFSSFFFCLHLLLFFSIFFCLF